MNSRELSKEQLEPLCQKTAEMNAWLHKLVARLEANRMPHDDDLLIVAKEATDKLQQLWIKLHYLSCDRTRNG